MLLTPKHLPRLAATAGLFTRYGLRDVAKQQGLLALTQPESAEDDAAGIQENAIAFRKRLVELGPAYIKLGQIMSTRPDLLPQPYVDELEHLQDDVPPLPFATVEEVIERELRARISTLFASFDEKPLGSASLGQVHAATLRDGRSVVVKVQRPGLHEQLADDLEYFHELAGFLAHHTDAGSRLDLVGVVQQVEQVLVDELDYRTEARNAAAFRRNLAEFAHILIPRVIEAYSTATVLTMEQIRGRKIDEIPPVTRVEHDFGKLAAELARAYLHQITVDGFFHADPHPGNLFIVLPGVADNPLTPAEMSATERRTEEREAATPLATVEQEAQQNASAPSPPDDPKIALIDFGMTAHLSGRLRDRVIRLLVSLADNHGDEAAETLIEMGTPREDFDRSAYVREVSALAARNVDRTVSESSTGRMLYQVIEAGFRLGLTLPSELTMLAKTVFSLDAVTRALDPTFNAAQAIRSYAMKIADERARRDFSPRQILQTAAETSALMRVLPHRLDVITEHLAANQFAIRLDTPQIPKQLEGMEKIANRIFTGLVLGGLLVASGLLMRYEERLGLIGFVIAGGLGLYMVLVILINDRRESRGAKNMNSG